MQKNKWQCRDQISKWDARDEIIRQAMRGISNARFSIGDRVLCLFGMRRRVGLVTFVNSRGHWIEYTVSVGDAMFTTIECELYALPRGWEPARWSECAWQPSEIKNKGI